MSFLSHITKFLLTAAVVATAAVLAGCKDDFSFYDDPGEGEATLSAEVTFSPVLDPLDGPASRTDGEALKHIKSLCLFIYGSDNKLIRRVTNAELQDLKIENNNKQLPDDINTDHGEHQAESITPKATFSIGNIPFGKYHIYAVANMGDLTEYTDADLDTPDKLKEVKLTWNEDNISANDQMFGYFTAYDEQKSQGFDAPLITVGKTLTKLHAWVKRAASKVTVAVDGSGLYNGVKVWIKSIQIRDIPRYCWLGKEHHPSPHYLLSDGEKTTFGTEGVNESGELVTKQRSWPLDMQSAHTETANAYYFYENMQGEGQSKHQVWEGDTIKFPDGNSPISQGYKDHQVAGTYIEVIGYYKSDNSKEGEGPIIYRFMLGKDVDTNFDAERNYHFKLTLRLRGYANDHDWHIVYDMKPEIIARSPYYISYVYDETMKYPIKIQGGELISLEATIPDNDINRNSWHAIDVSEAETVAPYWGWDNSANVPNNPGPWNGFLSLVKTTRAEFGSIADGFGSGSAITYTENYNYWNGTSTKYPGLPRGERVYDVTPGIDKGNDAEGTYDIINNGNGEWIANIPFYTRARVMVAQTGYTGNNPYVAYRRRASVHITAKIRPYGKTEAQTVEKDIIIEQMRRVVNPKGIWRSAGCTDPFHVKMMILPYESATDFEPLVSDGPWLAVIQQGDWFDIEPTDGISQKNPDGTVSGMGDPFDEKNPGSIIDFTFRPKGTTSTPRGGIIKIYYNNYSCIHRIFVRQGYDPVPLPGSSAKWHSTNLVTATTEASDPALEGSYFRQYNPTYPVAASNNDRSWFDKNASSRNFAIAGSSETKLWKNIKVSSAIKAIWNGTTTINKKTCRMAGKADLEGIINQPNTIYGYGVIFTDGTTETPTSVSKVYGYNPDGSAVGKGMRGVFICDSISGMNIFLPIGNSGYGRFKQLANGAYNRQANGYEGVLQYANRYSAMPESGSSVGSYGVKYKPLFWDLYRRQGALYWLREADGTKPILDINYYTFDFALTDVTNAGIVWGSAPDPSGSDALQIRMVED